MSKWEKKFGKYAIPNLTLILIMCYVTGYVLSFVSGDVLLYLTLDPYAILHGQVWRLFTWLIIPSEAFGIFTIIMLFFYWNLGTQLEHVWGVWRYNVFIFSGILLTVIGAFVCMGIYYLFYPVLTYAGLDSSIASMWFRTGSLYYSTVYVNLSIFLAYALTFPNNQVLLMFVVPVKVKWLGMISGVLLVLNLFWDIWQGLQGAAIAWFSVTAISAALLNILIFLMRSGNHMHLRPKQIKRRVEFKQDIRRNPRVTKHKCAVCGQTDEDAPDLEFRFCSKCNGNYEYCQNHLFTHTHVK